MSIPAHGNNSLNSGLKPKRGWGARNLRFIRHRVVPALFNKRHGHSRHANFAPIEAHELNIIWIGHAGFVLQFPERSVCIDPNWALWHGPIKRQKKPGLLLHSMPVMDAILVTHAHYDHLHKASLRILESRSGICVPKGSAELVENLGFECVHEMRVWQELQLGKKLAVMHTPSLHWGARFIHDTHRDFGGYLIKSGEHCVFHCGDSAMFDGFEEIGKRAGHIDVAIMPIGAYGAPSGRDVHMNPEQAVEAFLQLGADYLIPMHYGSFALGTEPLHEPLERLKAACQQAGISQRLVYAEEGHIIKFNKNTREVSISEQLG